MKMEWIDTHAHLYLRQFDEDRDELMANCLKKGVNRICLPDIDSTTTESLREMVRDFPDFAFSMSGLHPCSVKEDVKDQLSHVRTQLTTFPQIAVGEIGLDYYWDKTYVEDQKKAYRLQIEWARELNLPVIIHSRDSLDDTIAIIEELSRGDLSGIFHCFNGDMTQAKRIVDVGFKVGLGGVITFKKVDMDDVLKWLPDESYVLETDAPYLAPTPYRGKRNESTYIPLIGEYLSGIKNYSLEVIAENTTRNAKELFQFERTKSS